MSNYEQLIEALRCCIQNQPETCVGCTYNIGNNECNVKRTFVDAADAIEELQAIAHSHCVAASAYWEELEELKAQLPKRGEWIDGDARRVTARCSVCGHLRLGNGAEWANKHVHFCEVCGSRMGGQKA